MPLTSIMYDRRGHGNMTAAYLVKSTENLAMFLYRQAAMEVTPACEGPGDGNWKALDTGFAQVTGELEVA